MTDQKTQQEIAKEFFKGEGHIPVVPPKVVNTIDRADQELIAKFQNAFVPDLSDMVGALYTMDSSIRPLYQSASRIVGSAFTVKVPRGDNVSIHHAFGMLQKGDVLAVDARGDTESCGSGAGSVMPAIERGLAGIVVDGAWRDIEEFEVVGFPIYGKAISPFSPPKRRPGEINVPVCIGGVIVHPGDIIVIDREGGVVIPREHAEEVAGHVKDYHLRTSLEEWDTQRIVKAKEAGRQYHDTIFKARGGQNIT